MADIRPERLTTHQSEQKSFVKSMTKSTPNMYSSQDRKYHMGQPLVTDAYMNQINTKILHSKVNGYVKN
jgi:hypothetical protein